MFEFFDWIVNFFTSIWDFILGIIDSISMLFNYLLLASGLVFNLVSSMPSWLQAFGMATITISILFIIVGRQTGGQKQ